MTEEEEEEEEDNDDANPLVWMLLPLLLFG